MRATRQSFGIQILMQIAVGLEALNFTMAGAREGFGPFLGVFLQRQGFDPGLTGFAMSVAGLAGVFVTAPLGLLIDRIVAKRAAVAIAVIAIALGAGLIVASHSIVFVSLGQAIIGIADTSLAPLVAALTLGIVGRARYASQVARNETFNHGGNAANAAVSMALGYWFGLGWVAVAIAIMAAATSVVAWRIDPGIIDHEAARGGKPGTGSAWRSLVANRRLLVLGGAAFAFQASSGAMLPFMAQALVKAGDDPALVTGGMTMTVQVVMIGAAAMVPRLAERVGQGTVMSVALALVVVRAGLAAWSHALPVIAVIEVLEGLSMGLAGVAIPALVVDVMEGEGHSNAGLGGVMTAYGAGAALSPLLAGIVAQAGGFPLSFLTLGAVALTGLVCWVAGWRQAERMAKATAR